MHLRGNLLAHTCRRSASFPLLSTVERIVLRRTIARNLSSWIDSIQSVRRLGRLDLVGGLSQEGRGSVANHIVVFGRRRENRVQNARGDAAHGRDHFVSLAFVVRIEILAITRCRIRRLGSVKRAVVASKQRRQVLLLHGGDTKADGRGNLLGGF